jgi:hypothetical protein
MSLADLAAALVLPEVEVGPADWAEGLRILGYVPEP